MGPQVNKIIIVSLCDDFTRLIAERLSHLLGILFCDAKDLVEYELVDRGAIEENCTKEYLKNAEKKIFKQISSFENVVVAIGYDYFVHNSNILKEKAVVLFLKNSKTFVKENGSVPNFISYDTRCAELEKNCDAVLKIVKTDTNFVCNKILDLLGGIL